MVSSSKRGRSMVGLQGPAMWSALWIAAWMIHTRASKGVDYICCWYKTEVAKARLPLYKSIIIPHLYQCMYSLRKMCAKQCFQIPQQRNAAKTKCEKVILVQILWIFKLKCTDCHSFSQESAQTSDEFVLTFFPSTNYIKT